MQAEMLDVGASLLRSPPFPGVDATVVKSARRSPPPTLVSEAIDSLFAAIRDAHVGGRFWAAPAREEGRTVLIRVRAAADIAPLLAGLSEADRGRSLWVLPLGQTNGPLANLLTRQGLAVAGDVDPWSLLSSDVRLMAHGDDEWVALAHIAGRAVQILSTGHFGQVGANAAHIRQRVAQSLTRFQYRDPYTGEDASIEAAIAQLADWRRTFEANRTIVAACGIAWWKRDEIGRFLWTPEDRLRFFRSETRAIAYAASLNGAVAIWPSRVSVGMPEAAQAKGVPLVRIEDGFVRSVGLGSNLVPPSSVAVDRLGIHYDPSRESDLETLLASADFPPPLLARAERLRQVILTAGISKYGGDSDHVFPSRQPGRRLVLVPGQVEDDMSVQLGGGGLASNLELLRRARDLEPDAEIWFRPHPDVDAGHRKGIVRDEDALRHADRIVRGGGMARLLELVDAVQVLTSLTGFEALLRGRDVTCHGTPFYAGWGLTRDLAPVPVRRGRQRTLDQLVAAVLILYPRYLDPVTQLPCPPEILIHRMTDGTNHNRLGWATRIRKLQGRLMKRRP
jgi:capsular polysaccharide export protein